MALIDFYVRNQKLSKIGPKIVSDSINYVNCFFTFKTDDWNGIDKWVVISKGEESYRVNLIDDAIPKEAGLNLGAGLWNVSLFGENPEGTERITTNSVSVEVAKSTLQDGEPLPPIALTEAEQIASKAQRALDAANEVKSKAENGDFNGKPGEPGKDGENATPEQIAEAVEEYFEENPIPGGGSGGEVTAESIENALGYPPAKPSDIPTKTSQLENDEEFVDEERLKQYAQQKDDYALRSELPKVPTKVSAFENDADYAQKNELPTKTSDLQNDSGFITANDIPAPPEVPVKSVFGRTGNVTAQKGDYTAEMVGADKAGKAVEEVGKHNVDDEAHNDIRIVLNAIKASLEAFLNINDEEFDQLSELIQAIKNNAGSIEQLTSGKVNVSDIVNNLTTNVANKPLSAAQGVVLKRLVDSLNTLATGAKNTADEAKTAAQNASEKAENFVFNVEENNGTFSSSATFTEIKNAFDKKRTCVCVANEIFLNCVGASDNIVMFQNTVLDEKTLGTINVIIDSTNAVTYAVTTGYVPSLEEFEGISALANNANNNANTAKTTAANASNKVDNLEGRMDSGEFKGEDGADGERGYGILKVTTAPTAYTTATGGFTPAYRIALSTVKTQAKVDKVLIGDTLAYSYYQYPIGYVDSSYVYVGTRVSIRGSSGAAATIEVGSVTTGAAGTSASVKNSGTTAAAVFDFVIPQGPQGPAYTLTDSDKTTIVNAVIAALPKYAGEVS